MKNQIERAEPSRGAPDAQEQFIAEWWAKYGQEVLDAALKLNNQRVVLLEALRMAHRYFLQSNKLTVDDREMLDAMWAAIQQAERA